MLLAKGCKKLLPPGMQALGKSMLGKRPVPRWLNGDWFTRHDAGPLPDARLKRRTEQLRERLYRTLTESSLPMLLRYEDRNSMACSIESRVPFLTPVLAEFLLSLPEPYLISPEGVTKHVFREAMRGIVPNEILDRRDKVGFATPEKRWLQELRPWLAKVLDPDRIRGVPALNADVVTWEWQAVLDGRRRFDWRIWRWVNIVRWAEATGAEFD